MESGRTRKKLPVPPWRARIGIGRSCAVALPISARPLLWDRRTASLAQCHWSGRTRASINSLPNTPGRRTNRFRARPDCPGQHFSGLKLRGFGQTCRERAQKRNPATSSFGNRHLAVVESDRRQRRWAARHDVTNASRTQLMNLATLDWDAGLLEEFLIPRAVLPRIVASSEVYAKPERRRFWDIHRRHSRRPASRAGRQACFRPGGDGRDRIRREAMLLAVSLRRTHPVPSVLASPGRKQAWPTSAACWSPRMPAMDVPKSAGVRASP